MSDHTKVKIAPETAHTIPSGMPSGVTNIDGDVLDGAADLSHRWNEFGALKAGSAGADFSRANAEPTPPGLASARVGQATGKHGGAQTGVLEENGTTFADGSDVELS